MQIQCRGKNFLPTISHLRPTHSIHSHPTIALHPPPVLCDTSIHRRPPVHSAGNGRLPSMASSLGRLPEQGWRNGVFSCSRQVPTPGHHSQECPPPPQSAKGDGGRFAGGPDWPRSRCARSSARGRRAMQRRELRREAGAGPGAMAWSDPTERVAVGWTLRVPSEGVRLVSGRLVLATGLPASCTYYPDVQCK